MPLPSSTLQPTRKYSAPSPAPPFHLSTPTDQVVAALPVSRCYAIPSCTVRVRLWRRCPPHSRRESTPLLPLRRCPSWQTEQADRSSRSRIPSHAPQCLAAMPYRPVPPGRCAGADAAPTLHSSRKHSAPRPCASAPPCRQTASSSRPPRSVPLPCHTGTSLTPYVHHAARRTCEAIVGTCEPSPNLSPKPTHPALRPAPILPIPPYVEPHVGCVHPQQA
jgi:hypothetical protein